MPRDRSAVSVRIRKRLCQRRTPHDEPREEGRGAREEVGREEGDGRCKRLDETSLEDRVVEVAKDALGEHHGRAVAPALLRVVRRKRAEGGVDEPVEGKGRDESLSAVTPDCYTATQSTHRDGLCAAAGKHGDEQTGTREREGTHAAAGGRISAALAASSGGRNSAASDAKSDPSNRSSAADVHDTRASHVATAAAASTAEANASGLDKASRMASRIGAVAPIASERALEAAERTCLAAWAATRDSRH